MVTSVWDLKFSVIFTRIINVYMYIKWAHNYESVKTFKQTFLLL